MNVFEPLSTYSSPSRRAVESIEPKASDPELGSVIAHAPILSSVSRSGTHRSFWAIVPRALIAAEVSPTDTPIAVTIPGHTRHSSMIGIIVSDADPPSPSRSGFSRRCLARRDRRGDLLVEGDLLGEPVAGGGVDPELAVHLAKNVVRRGVAVLELVDPRPDLLVDELADGAAHHLLLFGPLEHGASVTAWVSGPERSHRRAVA